MFLNVTTSHIYVHNDAPPAKGTSKLTEAPCYVKVGDTKGDIGYNKSYQVVESYSSDTLNPRNSGRPIGLSCIYLQVYSNISKTESLPAVNINFPYESNNFRFVKGNVPEKKLGLGETKPVIHSLFHPFSRIKKLTNLTHKKVTEVLAYNYLLHNLPSSARADMTVTADFKISPVSQTIEMEYTAICGKWNEVLIVADTLGTIEQVDNLYGLHVSSDKKSIVGMVGFTTDKIMRIVCSTGVRIVLMIHTTHIERLI